MLLYSFFHKSKRINVFNSSKQTVVSQINGFYIIGRKHAVLPRAMNSSGHPTFVDGDAVDDDVAVVERDLVRVLSLVVVDGTEATVLALGTRLGSLEREIELILKHRVKKIIHWANLIVIITNGIKFIQNCKAPNYSLIPNVGWSSLTYCYQSVIGISLSLSKVGFILFTKS